jgi:hypothetical protein
MKNVIAGYGIGLSAKVYIHDKSGVGKDLRFSFITVVYKKNQ